jgi:succinate dehydrogenase hydrophobic anchor subunit
MVDTGWVGGSEVMVTMGVSGIVTAFVAGAVVACWLVQPEQKIRVIHAAITSMAEISFMILLVVEMIFSIIRFFDQGPVV